MDSLHNLKSNMNSFLQLPRDSRRTIYEQVSLRMCIEFSLRRQGFFGVNHGLNGFARIFSSGLKVWFKPQF